MQGNPPASIPALLRIAPEIRNKIIALATSDPADVTKLTLHPRGLVVMSEHYDLIDISFWNGSLCMVCKQLLNEIRAFLTSSITWAFRHAYMRDISQFPRRYYLEHTKTVEITDNLSFEFPFPLFNNLKEIHLGRIHESNAHYELSSDPIEAIRQIDWCIGDFSFISRAQERLLKRESIKSLLKRSKERFLVKETINIGGRWEFLNEEMKNNLTLTYDVNEVKVLQRVAITPEEGHRTAKFKRVWEDGEIVTIHLTCKKCSDPGCGRLDELPYGFDSWDDEKVQGHRPGLRKPRSRLR